jgi:hypothetical protein
MNIAILYPSNPLNSKCIDDNYREEYILAQKRGLNVHIIDIENIEQSITIPSITANSCIVYRGWMLSNDAYAQLDRRFDNQLLSRITDYYNAHYFPHWYQHLQPLTIPSIITDEEHALDQFKNFARKMFIKDYVKSLKTGKGSIVESAQDLIRAIHEILLRGY